MRVLVLIPPAVSPRIPTLLVKVTMKGSVKDGKLVADTDNAPSAGQFQATLGELKGYIKGRILPDVPLKQDFEAYELNQDTSTEC